MVIKFNISKNENLDSQLGEIGEEASSKAANANSLIHSDNPVSSDSSPYSSEFDSVLSSIDQQVHELHNSNTVNGNLFTEKNATLESIGGKNTSELIDDNGMIQLSSAEQNGTLTINPQSGDFEFQETGATGQGASWHENINYVLKMEDGSSSSHNLNISVNQNSLESPIDFASIDEEGLLPGTPEPTMVQGTVNMDSPTTGMQFEPLVEQTALLELNLKCDGTPLYYQQSDDAQELSAYQGANGSKVFTVSLMPKGEYNFVLFDHIDKEAPTNLLNELDRGNLPNNQYALSGPVQNDLPLQTENTVKETNEIQYEIPTQLGQNYRLNFSHLSSLDSPDLEPLEVFWNGELIQKIETSNPSWINYSMPLEGAANHSSSLIIKGATEHGGPSGYIDNLSFQQESQNKVAIELKVKGINGSGQLNVNVTSEPPIEIGTQEPHYISFNQSVYQTIIVTENASAGNNLNTLNLETLFDNLSIDKDNRQIDVVQRLENGQSTNVYEIQISDSASPMMPISIADIQLSFEGGDGGLDVLRRHFDFDFI